MRTKDIIELTNDEINARIREEKELLTRMRFNHAISAIENPAKIRLARKSIARLNTVLRQREINQ